MRLVGLRLIWGRVSRHGVFRGIWSLDTVGRLSRTVADADLTRGAIAGHDPKYPYTWASVELISFWYEVDQRT